MNTHNFTAVDFETATKEQMICEVGIVVVRNDKIVETFESLVQPPMNRYDKFNSIKNHITARDTVNSPTFDQLWPTIEKYFVNTIVVCHNRVADETFLHKNLDYYGIFPLGIEQFDCTCSYYKRKSLESLCAGFDMDYDSNQHHSALYDAKCCAEFAIHMYNGDMPDWDKVEEVYSRKKKISSKKQYSEESWREPLKGDVLHKDLSNADPTNPFYDRKVVVTGLFNIERKELGRILKTMGADIDTAISKRTNIVLIGDDPGPVKMEKLNKLIHDGYKITKLYQKDLDEILSGKYDNYLVEKEVRKDLDFTIEHYDKHHITFENDRNIISLKNLYYGKGFAGRFDLFCIITGNLGAAGDMEIYPETNICVLSDLTLEKLRKGEKDETILYIQNYYNNNKSITFELKFISESDILEFCKRRCEKCGDMLTLGYYERYVGLLK